MNTTGLREHVSNNRRQFLGLAAMSLAAAKFGFIDSANAQNSQSSAAPEAAIIPCFKWPHEHRSTRAF